VELRFVDKSTLRLTQMRKKVAYHIEWNLQNL
jgi:hypothetical protein